MGVREPNKQGAIGVLYGFRALMVLFVCNYHIWQRGWLGQYVTLFGTRIDFDFWTRSSYLFVDGMLLLSGFLLYLPYARQTEYGTAVPNVLRFYWNRVARIVPSYLASVLIVLFCIALPQQAYSDAATLNRDILTHLTFTFTFFPETYLFTPLNGVLWTVAIEVQFYILFPWLAKAIQKRPALVLCALGFAGVVFRFVVARSVSGLAMWVNQLPAFLDVYALGMLGTILFVKLDRQIAQAPAHSLWRRITAVAAPLLFAAGCWALLSLMHIQTDNGLIDTAQLHLSQWRLRLPLALTFVTLMLSAAFLPRVLQKLLDNRLMRFLSTISFNLYIWHQVIGTQLAAGLFPSTLHQDASLKIVFTLLSFSLAILAAMAVTYGLEQPASRLLKKVRLHTLKQ